MRLSADWMTGADDRILEFLREEGPAAPKVIFDDGRVRFSRSYINTRCKELSRYGMLDELGNGVYAISDEGEAYLDEELDAAELGVSGKE